MRIGKLIFIFFAGFMLFSCAASYNAQSLNANMKKLRLDMTKSEVISIVGDSYTITACYKDVENNYVEIFGYRISEKEEYKLLFISDKLFRWERICIPENVKAL